MPEFKNNRGFKMKGWSPFTKETDPVTGKEREGGKSYNMKKEANKLEKNRPEPTWMGTDEYRNPEDIPASEYLERGLNPADYIPGYKKKDIQIPRKK